LWVRMPFCDDGDEKTPPLGAALVLLVPYDNDVTGLVFEVFIGANDSNPQC